MLCIKRSQAYADLPSLWANESPLAMIPTTVMVTPFRPDIVVHNTITSSLLLFELTCILDSNHHLSQARSHKQSKVEYQQILAKLDRLNISNCYETLEISALGHYQQFSAKNTCNALQFICQDLPITKTLVRQILDSASKVCISASQRILMQETAKRGYALLYLEFT